MTLRLHTLSSIADPTDNIVSVYFGANVAACLNQTGTKSLQRATYLGMLGQALQQVWILKESTERIISPHAVPFALLRRPPVVSAEERH